MPPKRNTDRQPHSGISQFATKPPIAAPSVNPIVMHMTQATRVRFGLNSPTSAVAFGMMQPEPDAGDESQPTHLLDVLRVRGRDRHDGEEERGPYEHGPATDLVGHHAEHERADQHAESCRGDKQPAERGSPARSTPRTSSVAT